MKPSLPIWFVALAAVGRLAAADSEAGFKTIFDGKTFEGWRIGDQAAKSWRIEEGAFVAQGSRSHLYYVVDEEPFKDFERKLGSRTFAFQAHDPKSVIRYKIVRVKRLD